MRMAVCIKQVPETFTKTLLPDGRIRRDGQSMVMNPADVFALEAALAMKERIGGQVDVFTMGTAASEKILREAAALGADRLYLLSDKAFAGADTYATALPLSAALRKAGEYALVFCGRHTMDGETGQVPVQIAAMLGMPAMTDVVEIKEKAGHLICHRLLGDCEEQWECSLPAVVGIMEGIRGIMHPRLPSLAGLGTAAGKEVIRLDRESLSLEEDAVGSKGSFTEVGRAFFPDWGRSCRFCGMEEGLEEALKAIRRIKAEGRAQYG